MKKRYIILLSVLILIFCISYIKVGFLDGIFPNESVGSSPKFQDMGIEGNNSSDWYYLKNLKVLVTEKGTTLINNGKGNAFYSANTPSTTMRSSDDVIDWEAPYTVEFDLISGNESSIQIINKNNSTSRTFEQLGVTSNSHVKLVNDGNTVKYYINGVSEPIYTFDTISLNQTSVRFVIPENCNMTYKNFTIY